MTIVIAGVKGIIGKNGQKGKIGGKISKVITATLWLKVGREERNKTSGVGHGYGMSRACNKDHKC